MIRLFLISILFHLFHGVSAQRSAAWHDYEIDEQVEIYYGLFNNCIPFKIALRQVDDSIQGIWQMDNQDAYFLQGTISDNVAQLLEFDKEEEPTAYLFYRANIPELKQFYWVNTSRDVVRTLPVTKGKAKLLNNVVYCSDMSADICIKQTDIHSFRGTIYNPVSESFKSFYLNDSLYLTNYDELMPSRTILPYDHRIARNIRKCFRETEKNQIEITCTCSSIENKFLRLSLPKKIAGQLTFIEEDLLAMMNEDLPYDKFHRLAHVGGTEIIPFYVGNKIISFLVTAYNNNDLEIYTLNWNRKKRKMIHLENIFKKRFDLDAFIDKKSKEVKNMLRQEHKDKIAEINKMDFAHVLYSPTGFIFISEFDGGWQSFLVPYAELEKNYRKFHPLKKIMRHGN